MKFEKIFLYLFISGSFLNLMSSSPVLRGYSDDLFTHMDDKGLIAQEEFEDLYKALLEKDFFSEDGKRFILKDSIDKNILQSGPVLLNLIEWGQKNKQDDPMVQLLLQKLGRYFYFAFRDFVNEIDIERTDKGRFYSLLHEFYKFKVQNETRSNDVFQQPIYPFRATLSKALIFILIVNSANLSYKEKIKHSVYYLDKIKRELFEVKKTLVDCFLKDEEIDEFIEFLQVYSVAEPLLKPSFFKNFFKIISVVFACMVVIVLVVYFSLPYLIKPVRAYSDDLAKKMETAVAKTDEYKDGFLDYLESHWYTSWMVGSRDKKKKEDAKPAPQVEQRSQNQQKPADSAQAPAAGELSVDPAPQQSIWGRFLGWFKQENITDSQALDSLP